VRVRPEGMLKGGAGGGVEEEVLFDVRGRGRGVMEDFLEEGEFGGEGHD